MKIGILYVKGALPLFEDFGHLPTHTVDENGMINGVPAHKELDGLILPGGSIIESLHISTDLRREVKKIAEKGSFVLGMCSGFQLLANNTNIGRRSPCPIIKEGLGILDVTFSPLISNDRVEAEIVDQSYLTKGMVDEHITGFHCHTYGKIQANAPPICYSLVKRMNYSDNTQKILSGVRNDEGNVVGTMLHASLDENPQITRNILDYLDAGEEDILNISQQNQELVKKIKNEIGVNTNIYADYRIKSSVNSRSERYSKSERSIEDENSLSLPVEENKSTNQYPPMIMMASTGSDSGKTFLTTGIVGVLRSKGYRVAVLKVGPDIRDIVPSLYLNKENMETYSSIKIGHLGWRELSQVLEDLKTQNYDLVIVEGVMSVFTGLLNDKVPYSSAEIARAGNIPVLLVSPCNKGGIETAAIDSTSHVNMLTKMGIKTKAVILNKIYDDKIAEKARKYIYKELDVDYVELIPRIRIKERGNIPEVEMKLEEFCLHAMDTVENNMNAEKVMEIAEKPVFEGYLSWDEILKLY